LESIVQQEHRVRDRRNCYGQSPIPNTFLLFDTGLKTRLGSKDLPFSLGRSVQQLSPGGLTSSTSIPRCIQMMIMVQPEPRNVLLRRERCSDRDTGLLRESPNPLMLIRKTGVRASPLSVLPTRCGPPARVSSVRFYSLQVYRKQPFPALQLRYSRIVSAFPPP